MANEAGWELLNSHAFCATWDGRNEPDGVTLEWDDQRVDRDKLVANNFGSGVISWRVPYLFRTPPGWNLLVRGPANRPRDGASPLEGLVETDWAVATFTMNWKLTRPGHTVRFERGEPFCMLVPQRRGELESFSTLVQPVESDPETCEHMVRWGQKRHEMQVRQFLIEHSKDYAADWEPWNLDYFKGRLPGGAGQAPEHQAKLRLAEFAESDVDSGEERASKP